MRVYLFVLFLFLFLLTASPLFAAEPLDAQAVQDLVAPPANSESLDAVFYSEKIHTADGSLFSEKTLGVPWEMDANNDIYFLNNPKLLGPDGTQYAYVAGTDSIGPEDNESGFRSFYAIVPFQGRVLADRDEFVDHLTSMNFSKSQIDRAMEAYDAPPRLAPIAGSKLTSTVDQLVSLAQPGDMIAVTISLVYNPPLELPSKNNAMDAGLPLLAFQKSIERLTAIEQRKSDFASHQNAIVRYLKQNGATGIVQFWINNYISANVPVALIPYLESLSEVKSIELQSKDQPDAEEIKPPFARKVTQTEMFVDYNFDGLRGSSSSIAIVDRVRVGVGEKLFFETTHDAFLDASLGDSRVLETFNCNCFPPTGDYCADHTGAPDDGCDSTDTNNGVCSDGYRDYCWYQDPLEIMDGRHATSVLGIIAASCLDGECSQVSQSEWETKSGMSPNVSVMTFNTGGSYLGLALEAAIANDVNIFNFSASDYRLLNTGVPSSDDDDQEDEVCPDMDQATGKTGMSKDVNTAFKSGILFVKSAGNNRETCTWESGMGWPCTIGDPGAAAGAFTVGAYYSYWDDPYNNFSGSFDLAEYSGAGMTYDYRSKPDVVAPTNIACLPKFYDDKRFFDCTSPFDSTPLGGTSAATPVVSGVAANFLDWMMYTFGASIANYPGHLFANLINFGDRTGTESTGFFHQLNGAGRLRVRLPNSRGLDSSWHYRTHRALFFRYSTASYYLGNLGMNLAVPAGTDHLKIAVWWYDPEIELAGGGLGTAKFMLTLENLTQSTSETVLSYQNSPQHDEQKMQMIFDSDNALFDNLDSGDRLRLTVTNISMSTSGPAPMINSRMLYITYFWEDADRNDLDCAPCSDQVGPTRCRCSDSDSDYLFYR